MFFSVCNNSFCLGLTNSAQGTKLRSICSIQINAGITANPSAKLSSEFPSLPVSSDAPLCSASGTFEASASRFSAISSSVGT